MALKPKSKVLEQKNEPPSRTCPHNRACSFCVKNIKPGMVLDFNNNGEDTSIWVHSVYPLAFYDTHGMYYDCTDFQEKLLKEAGFEANPVSAPDAKHIFEVLSA